MIRNPFAAPIGRRLHRSTTRAVTLGSAAVLALGLTASLGPASAAPPASAKPVAHQSTATHPRDFDLRSNGAALARNDARLPASPLPGSELLPSPPAGRGLARPAHRHTPHGLAARRVPDRSEPTHPLPGRARLRARAPRRLPAHRRRPRASAAAHPLHRRRPASVTSAGPSRSAGVPLFGNGLKGNVTRDGAADQRAGLTRARSRHPLGHATRERRAGPRHRDPQRRRAGHHSSARRERRNPAARVRRRRPRLPGRLPHSGHDLGSPADTHHTPRRTCTATSWT